MTLRSAFNLIGICAAGAFTGTMLTIASILVPYWQSLPPGQFLDWFQTYESLVVRTIALVAVPAAIGVLGSLLLSLHDGRARLAWGTATAALLALAVITSVVHLPINFAFAAKTLALAEVGPSIDTWLRWHMARIVLGLLATVAGVVAVMPRLATEGHTPVAASAFRHPA